MAPTILVVGATGNTGRGVVKTLSEIVDAGNNPFLSSHRIIALTRSANGVEAQKLAALPHIEVVEHDWIDITAEWLRQNNVARAFIASPAQPSQFSEESKFLVAALHAGVEYVVRISTMAPNVRPDCIAYYPRTHWAIESMLSSPEFAKLQWTSLQPNVFAAMWLYSAVEYVKEFRRTGANAGPLGTMASEETPVGIVNPFEVGVFAAHLLASEDVSPHHKAKYVVNGPKDITGREVVALVEAEIGAKVGDVVFEDTSLAEYVAAQTPGSKSVILSIKHAMEVAWEGKCMASTTSKEVIQIAAPKVTPAEVFKAMLEG